MNEAVIKIIKVLFFGIVAWAISDVVFNILYESIDNAIVSSGENVTGLLKAMKAVAGLLAYDGMSFAVGLLTAIFTVFKKD
ncbi:MAG: hypothetical protein RBR27_05670 [Bacilli bacterium]|jgi:hypothetical protein|nr:hypothetical protein [Bacilli bacterium]